MSVYKRGSVWWYKFKICGQEIRQSAGTNATKTEAKRQEAQHREALRQRAQDAKAGLKPRHLFDDALAAWLEGEAKALKSYRETCNHANQVRIFSAGRWLHEGPEIAAELKASMVAEGLRPATVNQRLAVIRRVLNLAYQWGWLDQELGRKVKLLDPNNARHIYLTPEQLFSLADAAADPALPPDAVRPVDGEVLKGAQEAILLTGFAGLRLSELYSLLPEQLRDGLLSIPPSKGKKAGRIPLPASLQDVILPIKITHARLRRRFEAAREAIGMPELHWHDLRHTYASLLADAGAEMADIRDLLRHTSIASTNRYTHLLDERKKAISEAMHKRVERGTKRGTIKNIRKTKRT